MPVTLKVEYSSRVQKGIKNRVRKDIVNSIEGNSEMRKEMRRVFHMGNRRIQNLEKSGAMSPALTSLGKNDVKGFSKFSMNGSWEELKREYGRCIAFLNQPTSTANGAKEFERELKKHIGCSDEQWEYMKNDLVSGFNHSIGGIMSKIPYSELMQEIYERAEITAGNQMERKAILHADNLQQQVNRTADNIAQGIDDFFSGFEM